MNISDIEKNTDWKIEYYEEITSTSERAKEIAEKIVWREKEDSIIQKRNLEKNTEEVRAVIAEKQTKGKGTQGRVWLSSSGENILMTLLFYPQKTIVELQKVTYQIAEMIQSALKDFYDMPILIKLPNDLLLKGKKICGILTESSIQNGKVNFVLVGIGLNVNQVLFPEELKEIATSLKKEYPEKEWKREEIIVKIINNIKSLF